MVKVKVDMNKIPDEYKNLVHEDMTTGELAIFGNILLKHKIEKIKNRLFGWYYEYKNKRKNH